ncbi:MFS transporter [Streptomyces sp. NPDC086519]|uniref:MFS transporter n=1 Tax=Streptomyces sp. NPDC086519 TaxID=3154863 RepID=UPI00341CA73A
MLPGEDRAARRVLLVCMAAGATTLLDQAVLNIAVPSMRQSLGATGADVQWIVAGYSLAFGLALVPGGSLGDLHGRKRLFIAGVAVFLLAGLTAATAGEPGTLIGARLVQGAAAGLVNTAEEKYCCGAPRQARWQPSSPCTSACGCGGAVSRWCTPR